MRISDLKKIFRNAYSDYSTLANGVRLYQLSTGITAGVTTTTAPEGSLGLTSNATGLGTIFKSDGAFWQVAWGTLQVATSQSNVLVAGAGTTAVNGTYTYRGQFNGYAFYNLDGEDTDHAISSIFFDTGGDGNWALLDADGNTAYTSHTTAAALPWLGLWDIDGINPPNGVAPAPTVTEVKTGRFTLSTAQLGTKVKDTDTGFTYELIDPDNYDSEAGWKCIYPKWRLVNKIADYAMTPADSGTMFTNTGAAAGKSFILPDRIGCTVGDTTYAFRQTDNARGLTIDASTNGQTIYYFSSGTPGTATQLASSGDVGNYIELLYVDVNTWQAVSQLGTWATP